MTLGDVIKALGAAAVARVMATIDPAATCDAQAEMAFRATHRNTEHAYYALRRLILDGADLRITP
jgi:hypothetical protein